MSLVEKVSSTKSGEVEKFTLDEIKQQRRDISWLNTVLSMPINLINKFYVEHKNTRNLFDKYCLGNPAQWTKEDLDYKRKKFSNIYQRF